MLATVRAFAKLYTTEEMIERNANSLFSNTPIYSNDEPPMNNQQYCTIMASLHNPPDYGCQKFNQHSAVIAMRRHDGASNYAHTVDTRAGICTDHHL